MIRRALLILALSVVPLMTCRAETFQEWLARVNANCACEPGLIYVIGDSMVQRWRDWSGLLGPGAPQVVNWGIGGATTIDLIRYVIPQLAAKAPARVIVWIGTNDLIGTTDANKAARADLLRRRMAVVMAKLDALGVPYDVLAIAPTRDAARTWASTTVNRAVAASAADHPAMTFVDITPALRRTDALALDPACSEGPETVHIIAACYLKLAPILGPTIMGELEPKALTTFRAALESGERDETVVAEFDGGRVAAVPEPAAVLLFAAGLAWAMRRRG